MPEELRAGRQQRHDRRLIHVTPGRPKTADNEVQLVAEESVMRVGRKMKQQGRKPGRQGNAADESRTHSHTHNGFKSPAQPEKRCSWATTPELRAYHDEEWGVAVHDDRLLFEFLVLEGAQAGLSWETVLRKRARYRELFGGFEPASVARITRARVEKLMLDPGIIRNRAKIESTITNACAVLAVQAEFGTLAAFLWRFVDGAPIDNAPRKAADVPASTPRSQAMSRELLRRGFRFVGPTICYAFMQAVGMVNDHLVDCAFRHHD